jgi:acetyl-CoA carboxylase biotin carboxyl carrier protein
VPKEEKSPDKPLNPELQPLKELYDLMLEKGLDDVELKDEDSRIKLTRRFSVASSGPVTVHQASQPGDPAVAAESSPAPANVPAIPTPLAGVFYRASSPTSAPFVKEGDAVEPGQTLCIVEAMKVMNEIKTETRCKISRIIAENGRPVTAGQPLFEIEPA